MSRAPRWLVALVVPVALIATACGGGDEGGEGGVDATLSEFAVELSTDSASAGEVTFNIANEGEQIHELVIFQTDLAEDALPMVGDEVDEAGEGLTLVDEVEDVEPGATADLTMDLEAGSYVALCNVTGHYADGMHASFTVS